MEIMLLVICSFGVSLVSRAFPGKLLVNLTPFIEGYLKMNSSVIHDPKPYYVTHPNGEVEFVLGLNAFCKRNKLHAGSMQNVSLGKRTHHKGFKVVKASWADL
jgi:hypothetical protein